MDINQRYQQKRVQKLHVFQMEYIVRHQSLETLHLGKHDKNTCT
jgi:hypothetical protein